MVLCFCAVWLVPVGYGQADEVSRLIAALKHAHAKDRRDAASGLGYIKDPRAVEPLLAALKEPDLAVIAGAYSFFFIERAEKGSEDALIQALNASDYSKSMAEDYLNCGNSALEAAAREWAWKHGYQITAGGGGGTVRWGSRR